MIHFLYGLRESLVSTAPEILLQRLRARRRGEAFRNAGVAFVHVPRTAGTSITGTLYNRFIGHFGLADLLAVSPLEVLTLPRFSIARNPWDRLVSAWSFARAGGGESEQGLIRVHRPEQYAVPECASFENFVEIWLGAREHEEVDGIFRPQHHYLLGEDGRMAFDHVGRFEDLGATERWLEEVLGRPISFPRANASKRSAYRQYYTPHLRDMVAQRYARDITLLGYDF